MIRANANATRSPHPQPGLTLNTPSTAIPVSGTAWKPEPRPAFAQPSIHRLRLTSTAPLTVLAEFCTPTVRRASSSTRLEAAATAHPRNVDPTNTGNKTITTRTAKPNAVAVARPRYALKTTCSTTNSASATASNPLTSATIGLHTTVPPSSMPSGALKIAAAFATHTPRIALLMNIGTPVSAPAPALHRSVKVTSFGTSLPANAVAAHRTCAHAESSSTLSAAAANRSPSLALLATSGTPA